MNKRVNILIEIELHRKAKLIAKEELRSLGNLISFLLDQEITRKEKLREDNGC